jgi:dephospho-CoA kinase
LEPKVIAFAGGIGSGKSTVARAIAARFGCPIASFGDYVRSVLKRNGENPSRAALQRTSEQLIATLGWEGLTRNVLAETPWAKNRCLVVDGVRHPDVIKALKLVAAPLPVLVIYLDVEPQVRAARVAARDNLSSDDLAKFDRHSTESSVGNEVKEMADFRVNGSGAADQTTASVLQAIS